MKTEMVCQQNCWPSLERKEHRIPSEMESRGIPHGSLLLDCNELEALDNYLMLNDVKKLVGSAKKSWWWCHLNRVHIVSGWGGGGGGCHVILAWFRQLHVISHCRWPIVAVGWVCHQQALSLVMLSPPVNGVIVVVVVPLPLSPPWCHWKGRASTHQFSPPPCKQWLTVAGPDAGSLAASVQSLSAISTPNPPCEQLLAAVVMGAGVLIIRAPLSCCCLCPPSSPCPGHLAFIIVQYCAGDCHHHCSPVFGPWWCGH